MEALDLLENVDDDLDRLSVGMVKVSYTILNQLKILNPISQICEPEAFKDWGITGSSAVLYFENGIPNMYAGWSPTEFIFSFHVSCLIQVMSVMKGNF